MATWHFLIGWQEQGGPHQWSSWWNQTKSPQKGLGVDNYMQNKQERTTLLSGVMDGSAPTSNDMEARMGQKKEGKRKVNPSASSNGAQPITFAIGSNSLDRDKGPFI